MASSSRASRPSPFPVPSRLPPALPVTSLCQVASRYFRAGADKVSLGSDAVEAVKAFLARGRELRGDTAIEQISLRCPPSRIGWA